MTDVTIKHRECGTNTRVPRMDWESGTAPGVSRDLRSYRCWKCKRYYLREEYNEVRIGRG